MAHHKDVSSLPEYAGLVGTTYRTREAMLIYGVTLDANYAKVVDIYALTTQPGIGGPEILFRSILPVGTTIRVARVLDCTNCIFGGGDEVEVELPDLTDYAAHPIRMSFTFGDDDIVMKHDSRASLNPSLFEMIER
jgi:hypothetical protein